MSAHATPPSSPAYAVIQDHPERIRFPLMEQPFVGFLLAFIAGTLNAWTLANASTFSTVQSGNVLSSGYWLIQGDWEKFQFPFISVIAFGVGSALAGVLMTAFLRSGRTFTVGILSAQVALLVILGTAAMTLIGTTPVPYGGALDLTALPEEHAQYIAYAISFVAGAQGNAFHKNHGMLYGAVAVTFVVQMAFNFLVQAAFSKEGINKTPNLKWAGIFFLTLLGFAGGGGIGFLADHLVNGLSIFLAAAVALCVLIAALAMKRKNVDPTAGGTFA
ncbi:hypothetical protein GCM10022200_17230 [Microbacterium awajiense]|uniref:DUF1275 domain-containing protein n=1 Tax=Microbacterium awajiense TaxID=415214 RepID=A0ABP7AKA9_9MICO